MERHVPGRHVDHAVASLAVAMKDDHERRADVLDAFPGQRTPRQDYDDKVATHPQQRLEGLDLAGGQIDRADRVRFGAAHGMIADAGRDDVSVARRHECLVAEAAVVDGDRCPVPGEALPVVCGDTGQDELPDGVPVAHHDAGEPEPGLDMPAHECRMRGDRCPIEGVKGRHRRRDSRVDGCCEGA